MKPAKGKIYINEPLGKHTTFRIGGPCTVWCEPASWGELKSLLRFAALKRKKVFVMGMGSNVLADEGGFDGFVMHLGHKNFKKVIFSEKKIIAGAGIALNHFVNLLCEKGYEGLEGLTGIPGTLGGAIFMNAGYRGNISDNLESVKVMKVKNRKISTIKKKDIKFGYRYSDLEGYIILEGAFHLKKNKKKIIYRRKREYLETKKREQPIGLPSAGCFFKNPKTGVPAALLIDMLHLKGKRIGGAEVSKKHANFIVNAKHAKSKDVLKLADLIKKRVKMHFGVDLRREVIVL